jgi:dimethylargininase
MPVIAFLRDISPKLTQCELSFLAREPIDLELAQRQHRAYAAELAALGCRLERLPALPQQPDGVFVEDTAIVLEEGAVITRPGVASRRPEVESVAVALAQHLPVQRIESPATLEGGDVLRIGRTLYVGASARSNAAGIAQLSRLVRPQGFAVKGVSMRDCLHLKSALTFIPPDLILVNPAWVDPAEFAARAVAVHAQEAFAANTLSVGGVTLMSAAYPRTREILEAMGVNVRALDVSELHKAEAALTCLSLLVAA